jgi:DNA adenine methylase
MMHSALRYPGGKSDFLGIAKRIFEECGLAGKPLMEPYAGSAAVSLGLLDLGLTPRVTLLERDPLLFAFWKALFTQTDEFITRFQELEITVDTWQRFRPYLKLDAPLEGQIVECGLAALFYNRANFSGILNGGPIGGLGQKSQYKIDCRTNKDLIISRLLASAMFADSVEVLFGDAVEHLKRSQRVGDQVVYLDPPYFNKGDLLYRYFYKLRQHKELAAALSAADFWWFLSYDDHHVIEFLYEDFYVRRLDFRYSARTVAQRTELLISNFAMPALGEVGEPIPRRLRGVRPTAVLPSYEVVFTEASEPA